MSLFSNFFGKEIPGPFTGHVLDAIKSYFTTTITPETVKDAEKLAEIYAHGKDIYIIAYYEDGKRIENLVPKAEKPAWLKLKHERF